MRSILLGVCSTVLEEKLSEWNYPFTTGIQREWGRLASMYITWLVLAVKVWTGGTKICWDVFHGKSNSLVTWNCREETNSSPTRLHKCFWTLAGKRRLNSSKPDISAAYLYQTEYIYISNLKDLQLLKWKNEWKCGMLLKKNWHFTSEM